MLDDLDDARLKQAGSRLGQRAFCRSTDEPLQLVTERIAETLCERHTYITLCIHIIHVHIYVFIQTLPAYDVETSYFTQLKMC